MNKLYIVRHGKTDWNDKSLLQGSTDIEINEDGIRGAKELASVIDLDKIDICICSPLKRAIETANIIVGNKKEIIYDDLLVERSFGDYEGKKINYDLIYPLWNYKLNYSSNNVENIRNCLLRANKLLNKIKNEYSNKSILIVSHGSFIKALHYNIIGYSDSTDFLSFNPRNTTLYKYELE